jgi:hypothetical protein
MLLLPNKKKIATIIIGRMKQPDYVQNLGDEPKGEFKLPEDEEGSSMGLEAAMDDLIAAIESKDAKAMAEAFKSACALADAEEDDAEAEQEMEG